MKYSHQYKCLLQQSQEPRSRLFAQKQRVRGSQGGLRRAVSFGAASATVLGVPASALAAARGWSQLCPTPPLSETFQSKGPRVEGSKHRASSQLVAASHAWRDGRAQHTERSSEPLPSGRTCLDRSEGNCGAICFGEYPPEETRNSAPKPGIATSKRK